MFDAGGARKCCCQALKVPGWIWRDTTQEERDAALVEQTGCGTSGPTSGLIGYVDGEPAGWVAVEPRINYPRIWARQKSWMRMDPDLEGVWSVTCFVVRKGFRRQGLMYELAAATVEYGKQVGARVLEGYPTEPPPGKTVIWDEASVGLVQVFLDAGYEIEASPTVRRRVVRHLLGASPYGRLAHRWAAFGASARDHVDVMFRVGGGTASEIDSPSEEPVSGAVALRRRKDAPRRVLPVRSGTISAASPRQGG